jgi:hypothetical protein
MLLAVKYSLLLYSIGDLYFLTFIVRRTGSGASI